MGLPFSQILFKGRRFWRVVGMLAESEEGIHVEWQSDEYERPWGKAVAVHMARGPINNVLIPWSAISEVTFRGKLFGPGQLRIAGRSLTTVEALPGAAGNVWWVRIERPERRNARELVLTSEGAIANANRALLNGGRGRK